MHKWSFALKGLTEFKNNNNSRREYGCCRHDVKNPPINQSIYQSEYQARKQQVIVLQDIGLTRPGVELLISRTLEVHAFRAEGREFECPTTQINNL